MKTKQFNKKLSLNKKTVANLNNDKMNDVRGGTGAETGFIKCRTPILTQPIDPLCNP